MDKTVVALVLAGLLILAVSGGQQASILTPFTQVTLSDGNSYWVSSWIVSGSKVGDTTFGTLSSQNVTSGNKIYSIPRDNGFLMTATAQQPYVRASVSEADFLKNSGGSKVLSKFSIPVLGEKHTPFVFAVSDKQDKGGSYSYDTFISPDQFTIPSTQVQINVAGQLGKGYVDPDLSNVLVFKGFNSNVCGTGIGQCDWQVDRGDWQNVQITGSEQQKCNFPYPLNVGFGASAGSIFSDVKRSCTEGMSGCPAEQYASALRCWSATHSPLGFAQSVTYTGFKNPLNNQVETAKVHWNYPFKSFSSVINVKIPLAMANTFIYDIPSLQSCQLSVLSLSFNKIGSSGSEQSVRVKNVGGSSCSVSALFRVKSGFGSVNFAPNPVSTELRVGDEAVLQTFASSGLATQSVTSTICVSVSSIAGALPEQCGNVEVNTGGTPPLPTPTPSPSASPCPPGTQTKTVEQTDFFGQKTVTTSCEPLAVGMPFDLGLILGLLVVLLFAYGVASGKIVFDEFNASELVVPGIFGAVAWLVLASFSLPLLGNVFAGFSFLVGLIIALVIWLLRL